MKKLITLALIITVTTSCVNGKFGTPEQDQENQETVTLIQFTF